MSDELDEFVNDETEDAKVDANADTQDADSNESTGDEGSPPEPADGQDNDDRVPRAAMLDERAKRQELEREIAELRTQQGGNLGDPEPLSVEQQVMQIKIGLARDLMMSQHDDYAEKESVFMQMTESNPVLVQQMLAANNPARFAYDMANKKAEMDQLSDIDAYKAKIREEVLAELKAKSAPSSDIPDPSIVDAPGVSERVADSEPDDLESITLGE